jgi:hypothetical protein
MMRPSGSRHSASSQPISRAAFLRGCIGLVATTAFSRPTFEAAPPAEPLIHPDPRPGITAERVLAAEALGTRSQKVLAAYGAARLYPEIFDGLGCGCGCTEGKHATHRSLLVCYETKQPTGCWTCQQEAEFVRGLADQKTSLTEIRAAVDKKFG